MRVLLLTSMIMSLCPIASELMQSDSPLFSAPSPSPSPPGIHGCPVQLPPIDHSGLFSEYLDSLPKEEKAWIMESVKRINNARLKKKVEIGSALYFLRIDDRGRISDFQKVRFDSIEKENFKKFEKLLDKITFPTWPSKINRKHDFYLIVDKYPALEIRRR